MRRIVYAVALATSLGIELLCKKAIPHYLCRRLFTVMDYAPFSLNTPKKLQDTDDSSP